jgi:hypothetical protein
MTATLPPDIRDVFERFVTTEYVTVDRRGQPIVWPVTPYHHPEEGCIDITTGLGYPKKADDAQQNPHVALLFSDGTGSGIDEPPTVLVQGTAAVDDRDLSANAERYLRESAAKLPVVKKLLPPKPLMGFLDWYIQRIYVHVRPERVYVWPRGDTSAEPQLLDSHIEEVRSGHSEEPEAPPANPDGGSSAWHERLGELGTTYSTAVLAIVGPDGFPFATRVPVHSDPSERVVRIEAEPIGAPLQPGLACLSAHAHAPDFSWQRNFQVRGDLVESDDGWVLAPHKVIGGMELPPSAIGRLRANARKVRRWRKTAKREQARRNPQGRNGIR